MNAIYGTFNIEMCPFNIVDVTNKIKPFIKGTQLEIPKETNFSELFGNHNNKGKNYLQVTTNGRTYNILEDQYIEDIKIDLANQANKIKMVYYIYTSSNSNWRAIISGQLYQLKSYGILTEADLYIHITDNGKKITELNELITAIVPNAIISSSTENQFEYPALKLLHDLATQYADNNFLYFHTKGMTHNLHSRSLQEMMLFTKTFENWRKNLQFLNKPGVEKVGLFPSIEGWIWYNFWYAKGKYLSRLEKPEISDFRYYYESWLGLADPDRSEPATNCYNLFEIKNVSKTYFSPVEADVYKENLMEKLFSHAESKEFRLVRTRFMIYSQLKADSFFKRFKKKNLVKALNKYKKG